MQNVSKHVMLFSENMLTSSSVRFSRNANVFQREKLTQEAKNGFTLLSKLLAWLWSFPNRWQGYGVIEVALPKKTYKVIFTKVGIKLSSASRVRLAPWTSTQGCTDRWLVSYGTLSVSFPSWPRGTQWQGSWTRAPPGEGGFPIPSCSFNSAKQS